MSKPKQWLEEESHALWKQLVGDDLLSLPRMGVHLRTFWDDDEAKRELVLQNMDRYWDCVRFLFKDHTMGSNRIIFFASDNSTQKDRAVKELAPYGKVVSLHQEKGVQHSLNSSHFIIEWFALSQCKEGLFTVGSTWSTFAFPRLPQPSASLIHGPSRLFNTPLVSWGYDEQCQQLKYDNPLDVYVGDPGEVTD